MTGWSKRRSRQRQPTLCRSSLPAAAESPQTSTHQLDHFLLGQKGLRATCLEHRWQLLKVPPAAWEGGGRDRPCALCAQASAPARCPCVRPGRTSPGPAVHAPWGCSPPLPSMCPAGPATGSNQPRPTAWRPFSTAPEGLEGPANAYWACPKRGVPSFWGSGFELHALPWLGSTAGRPAKRGVRPTPHHPHLNQRMPHCLRHIAAAALFALGICLVIGTWRPAAESTASLGGSSLASAQDTAAAGTASWQAPAPEAAAMTRPFGLTITQPAKAKHTGTVILLHGARQERDACRARSFVQAGGGGSGRKRCGRERALD